MNRPDLRIRVELDASKFLDLFAGGNHGDKSQPGFSLALNALEQTADELRIIAYALMSGDPEEVISLKRLAEHCFHLAHQCDAVTSMATSCEVLPTPDQDGDR